jgi:hypothetical protein
MEVFFNPTDKRVYITKETPTIDPLPLGLNVTIIASGRTAKITYYNEENKKYRLDQTGNSSFNENDTSDFRFNPDLVDIKYDNKTNSISFSNKETTSGGKNIRKTKRKMNKKRKSSKRR